MNPPKNKTHDPIYTSTRKARAQIQEAIIRLQLAQDNTSTHVPDLNHDISLAINDLDYLLSSVDRKLKNYKK